MTSVQKPIVVVGSINIDLVANAEKIPAAGETVRGTDFQVHPGGKGANQAVAVARLGYPVQLVGKVGTDSFGDQVLSYLQQTGVDVEAVEKHRGTSGVAIIAVSPDGENSIIITPGANAHVTPDFLNMHHGAIRNAGIVLAQLEIPIETVEHLAKLCSDESVPLMLDPAPARALPDNLFPQVHWFTPNETEAAFYAAPTNQTHLSDSAQIARALLNARVENVVLKLGSRGAFLASANGFSHTIPAFPVKAVDTTAAGDAYNGAFATALMLGMEPVEAARFAAAAAAISVTRPGAQPSMPTRAEVEALLETGKGT
ncbi:ribokinase [Alloacidobacterium dinghuense]|uniref:Ribokinase n=1 Tax=Alloacidobacterium dinghuense TaxID=2763107 RepID=A0A7G8BKU9_9BACT|nr:ribokinase [Alloacidobacterium dinghuense]QNI33169.1 ribokinase [Alloacidobacterium dinghuense]